MCLIVAAPSGCTPDEANLRRGFYGNNDGAGFSFIDPETNDLSFVRSLGDTYSEWSEKYNAAREKAPDSPFLIHFRMATHGTVTADNVQPFEYPHGAFAHNGIMQLFYDRKQPDVSDSKNFISYRGSFLTPHFLRQSAVKHILSDSIGWSKLAFLHRNGELSFVNEADGIWNEADGCWYSNSYSLGYNRYTEWAGSSSSDTTFADSCGIDLGD